MWDTVVGHDGKMSIAQVPDLLICFYRGRMPGPTQSGGYVPPYPPGEELFLRELCASGPIPFSALLDALQDAQANLVEPEAPLEYNSNAVLRNDMLKHTRKVLGPQQQFRNPLTTAQEVGWELGARVPGDMALTGAGDKHPFHLRTSATTQFQDAQEKHTWGRSIGGEFSAYAAQKLAEFGGLGMGV